MQHPQQMIPMLPSFPPPNITTEQIQKYLDDNKKLILAILDNQNLGKLAECAQYQAQLQKNLMYLAAIADAQPQAPTMPAQMAPHPAMQQGAYYMQHPQPSAMPPQAALFPSKMPMQFNTPAHLLQDPQQLQQAMQSQLGMRPMLQNNGMHSMHANATIASGGPSTTLASIDGRGISKQDVSEGGAVTGEGKNNSAMGGLGGEGNEVGK